MENLVKAQDYLKSKIKDTYRLAHSYRVANIGKEIAEKEGLNVEDLMIACLLHDVSGSLTLAHSQNSQMSFMYGFFFVKFLFLTVVCVVIVI